VFKRVDSPHSFLRHSIVS